MTNAAQQAPVDAEGSGLRWPGATARFALFAEVLWVGVLVALVSLPILTLPAALAAGSRHLRRFLAAEASTVGGFFRDVRMALPGGMLVAAVALPTLAVLVLNISIALGGSLPGGEVIAVLAAGLILAVLVALLLLAGSWAPGRGWRASARSLPRRAAADLPGAGLIAVAVLLTAVVAWQLPPLLVPGLGCLVFALVAVTERRRAR